MKIFILLFVALVTSSVIAVEETEGMRAMRLGCEKQKLGLGCTNYANFLIKNHRESEADAYFEKGCKLGNQDGCDKKRWPVKEVITPEPEAIVESPIEETPTFSPSESPVVSPAETPVPSPEESPTFSPSESTVVSPDESPTPSPAESPTISSGEKPAIEVVNTPEVAPLETPAVSPVVPETTPAVKDPFPSTDIPAFVPQ